MKKISALLLLGAIALSGCSAPGTTSGVVASEPVSAGKLYATHNRTIFKSYSSLINRVAFFI